MMDPLMGMMIQIVEPGTVVGKDDKDQDMIVTDTNIVCNGNRMWVTQTVWDRMKDQCK